MMNEARNFPVMFPYDKTVVSFHWELDQEPEGEALPFDEMVRQMFPDLTDPDYAGFHETLVEGAHLLRLHGGLRVVGATGVTTYLRAVGRDPETFGTMLV